MARELSALLRVRDLRSRRARETLSDAQQAVQAAEAKLTRARRRQMEHERQAALASAFVAGAPDGPDAALLSAAEAQRHMDFAAAARFRAGQVDGSIRRAKLVRERAREEAGEAATAYRREARRCEAVTAHWKQKQQADRRRAFEREDETLIDEQITRTTASPASRSSG